MKEQAQSFGKQVVALLVLLVAAYVLFKIVIGFVAGVVWLLIVVLALAAIVWALRVL
jgi:hypothetical protein